MQSETDPNLYISRLKYNVDNVEKIDHPERLSSDVFKLQSKDGAKAILKVFLSEARWRREHYFLTRLRDVLPVAKIIQVLPPENEMKGALLLSFIHGDVPSIHTLNQDLAFQMGTLLAKLHQERTESYGDPSILNGNAMDSPSSSTKKYFHRCIRECQASLAQTVIEACELYFSKHITRVDYVDGPCIVHGDFKPGNLLVDKVSITGVLDFENSRVGFAEEDFFILDAIVWNINDFLKPMFLKGYASIRSIPELDELMQLYLFLKALEAVRATISLGTHQDRDKAFFEKNLQFIVSITN